MSDVIASNSLTLIVGLGATGLSVARYLSARHQRFCFADELAKPERIRQVQELFPQVHIEQGPFEYSQWQNVTRIVLSPGVARRHPAIQQALAAGIEVIGDIELFAREAKAPIVAITGSNGKTTVTQLLGKMAEHAGVKVAVGGNIGTPALALLGDGIELYVLELSSFQLESTSSLSAAVATVLNVSQDHLDRYKNINEYFLTKQIIYHRAQHIVVNRDDVFTQPPLGGGVKATRFGRGQPDLKDFGLTTDAEGTWLAFGLKKLLRVDQLQLCGTHNFLNALAALALGNAVGLDMAAMLACLKQFHGLEHRCQKFLNHCGVDFVNDSKATNVGATLAALTGLAQGQNIVLLAGGDGKGADFTELRDTVSKTVKALILFGKDADDIAQACADTVPISYVNTLAEAVDRALHSAEAGDIVLLSPACASMDMFKNYQDRGQQFIQLVENLCQV